MYPHGRADCGALDMAGNLWEWCLNDYSKPEVADGYGNGESKVLRGGSFYFNRNHAAASARYHNSPYGWYFIYGLRVVLATLLAHPEL
jgi:formylglycine-generating enzyme required for sulfatase activity